MVLTEARGFWLLGEGHSTKRVGNHVILKLRNWLENICYCFLGRDVMNFQLVETEGHLLERILRVHSPNLSWLSWRHCPYNCLPSWITIKNLRVLKVEGAVLKTLWQGISQAPLQLQELDLSSCTQLERLPDSFGNLTNLHSLNLRGCEKLESLPDSFGSLSSLGYFNASCCANLTISSEAFGNIRTLEHIDLSGCEKVEVWPSQLGYQRSLKVVKLTGTNLKKELPSAFELPSDLEVLWIGNPLLETVMPSLGDLRKLKELRLEYRGELKCLSASVEGSSQLSWLKVAASPIIHTSEVLSDEVVYPNLSELMLEECINLVEVGTLPKALTSVTLISCYNLRSIQGICGLAMLQVLHIEKCNELEELRSVETMVSLQRLYAIDCAKLKSIRDLAQLTKLRRLNVQGCPKLQWDEGVVERLRQRCWECRLEEPNGS